MITTHNLSIGYHNKVVQSKLNLSTDKAQLICLTGTNGAGKSTLIRTLAHLQPALKGEIFVNNQKLTKLSIHECSLLFSLVLTDKIDNQNLTVYDLVAMGRIPYSSWMGKLTEQDKKSILESINFVNMQHKMHSYLAECSDGEKQRAVIAMTLAQDTPIVLLDEPTAHLDLPNRIEIMLLLRRLSIETHKTFILSTHELDLAIQLADSIWLMTATGVEVGIPEDLMLNESFTKAFGSKNFNFNKFTGHCQIQHPHQQKNINIIGEQNTYYAWLHKALLRIGYIVNATATEEIQVLSNSYIYKNKEYHKIQELLSFL